MSPRKRRASRFPHPGLSWRHKAPAVRLAGQIWNQSNAITEKQEGTPRWRGLAAALAAVELVVAVFLAAGPLFQVRQVDVQGSSRVGAGQHRLRQHPRTLSHVRLRFSAQDETGGGPGDGSSRLRCATRLFTSSRKRTQSDRSSGDTK